MQNSTARALRVKQERERGKERSNKLSFQRKPELHLMRLLIEERGQKEYLMEKIVLVALYIL